MPVSPEMADAKKPAPGRFSFLRCLVRFCGRAFARLLGASLIAALAFALWTHGYGSPSFLVARAEALLSARLGGQVRLGGLGWSLEHGVQVRQFAWFRDSGDLLPVFEAGEASLYLPASLWLKPDERVWQGKIHDALVRYEAEGALQSDSSGSMVRVPVEFAAVQLEASKITVERLHGRIGNLAVDASGTLRLAPPQEPPPAPSKAPAPQTAATVPSWLARVLEGLRALDVDGRARASVSFDIDPARPQAGRITLRAGGEALRIRGARFASWRAQADMADGRVEPLRIQLRHGAQEAVAEVRIDLTGREWSGSLRSDLPAPLASSLLPEAYAEALAVGRGPLRLDLEWGPASLDDPLRKVRASASVDSLEARSVWLEQLSLALARDGDQLVCEEFSATVGRGAGAGPASGRFTMDLATGRYELDLETGFDPALALTLFPREIHGQLRALSFHEELPSGRWRATGSRGDPRQFGLDGSIRGRRFHYRGVFVESLETDLSYSGQRLRLDPFQLARSEGEVKGWIDLDFEADQIRFAADSTIGLHPAARMIHPTIEKIVGLFRAEGSAAVKAEGLVDYGEPANTHLDMQFKAGKFGYKWFLADRAEWTLQARGRVFDCQDLRGDLYGGTFDGSFRIEVPSDSQPLSYRVETTWREVDFGLVAMYLKDSSEDPYRGRFNGSVELSGRAGDVASIKGEGRFAIRGAYVFRIPLLGGLSRLLSVVLPGVGYTTPSDLRCSFVLADGKASSEDILIRGALVTIQGMGDYYFDQRLNFRVEAEPLGKGVIGDAVRLISTPLSTLLKFRLHGTLAEPEWTADSWPADLLRRLESIPSLILDPGANDHDRSE